MSTSQGNPFDSEAVAALDRQFALLAAHERPILWQHATQPQFTGLREWLEEELASFR